MASKWMFPAVLLAGMILAGGDGGTSTAKADNLVYKKTTTVFTNQTHGSGTFSLPQFNPSLGILTRVDLSILVISSGGAVEVENLLYSPVTAVVWWGATVEVELIDCPSIPLGVGTMGVSLDAYRQDTVLLSKNNNTSWSGFDYVFREDGTSSSDPHNKEWSFPDIPRDFRGTSDLLFDYNGFLSGGTLPASSNFRKRIPSDAKGDALLSVKITYQYTVPEVGTVTMAILGGLGLLRRRGRSEAR